MKDNKLIAEFMGFQKTNLGWFDNEETMDFNSNNNTYDFYELKFHSSWDWLMPVAERCLCTDEKTDGQHYFINDSLLTCNIEVVYDRVVEFIKDYNESI